MSGQTCLVLCPWMQSSVRLHPIPKILCGLSRTVSSTQTPNRDQSVILSSMASTSRGCWPRVLCSRRSSCIPSRRRNSPTPSSSSNCSSDAEDRQRVVVEMPSKRSPAVHNISFCGLTGAIFVLLTAAVILYIEAFVTTSWTVKENDTSAELEGLWQTCSYVPRTEPENSWLKTSQVLISIGFFCLIASFILSTIYMTANRASKNVTITSLAFVCFVTVVFVVIGVTVYGIHARYRLSWSFGVTIASAVLTFVAGILTILQLRRSNVRIF